MGLDLVVEGCPRPGHEAEWRQILERSFGNGEPAAGDLERFGEISTPPHERVGAPRVGHDAVADEWIVAAGTAKTPEEVARMLKDMHGYYVLRLVQCDGIPTYSNGGLYEGVNETSFRGDFLADCGDVLQEGMIAEAWNHKFPEEAIHYGDALLAAADAAESGGPPRSAPARSGLFSLFRREAKASSTIPFEEQLDIFRAAGRWYRFGGERGHAIRAWF